MKIPLEGVVQTTIGGHLTLCGGTRTAVKTVRPWQVPMNCPQYPHKREDCPLCTQPQIDEHSLSRRWKGFQNNNSPFSFHRLITPDECWDAITLWSLGGGKAAFYRTSVRPR
ncbi:MAG: hypothetical protein NUV53_05160 [Patescibacteria group bacterium]|nr:hypothetical protein [Patescibacteria group bacterium]